MEGTAHGSSKRRLGGSPQLECRGCRMPVLLVFVERRGDRRWIDCPYCGRHDEWKVPPRP